jgi:hypothetical protein
MSWLLLPLLFRKSGGENVNEAYTPKRSWQSPSRQGLDCRLSIGFCTETTASPHCRRRV